MTKMGIVIIQRRTEAVCRRRGMGTLSGAHWTTILVCYVMDEVGDEERC